VFDDIDACAKVELAKATQDPTQSYAGLLFWVQDGRNYYQAVIAPNGYFTVARIVDGKVVAKRPVDWKKLDSIQTGAEQKNTLRVTAKGPAVQISVNGKTAASFTGEPPRSPSYLGMMAASADSKKGDSWSVSDLKETAPQSGRRSLVHRWTSRSVEAAGVVGLGRRLHRALHLLKGANLDLANALARHAKLA
jgi:hypothetical protein